MNRLHALLPVAMLGLAGCADFKDLIALQRGLMAEFPRTAININVTNDHLSVLFQDSTTANLPETQRAAFARRVAEFVRDHYAGYNDIAAVSVGFSKSKWLGPITSTETEMPYSFSRAELGPALAPAVAPAKR